VFRNKWEDHVGALDEDRGIYGILPGLGEKQEEDQG
jgi:hypothetical protein